MAIKNMVTPSRNKFRIWSVEKNDWIKHTAYKKLTSELISFANGVLFINTKNKNFIVMQSTGLEDSKGKEIYEGDIVEYDGFLSEIKWSGSTGYRITDRYTCRSMKRKGYNSLGARNMGCTIVGNIMQNINVLHNTRGGSNGN